MKIRTNWVKLLVLGVAGAVAAEVYLRQSGAAQPAAEGAAPAFALPDLRGETVRLEALRGKVVALNFWATWCGPCREEIPELARVYRAHQDRCFEMLGVAEESGSREEVADAARRFGINYPVLLDDQGAAGDAYRIPGYPRTYLIDHQGNIRRTFEGAVSRSELESALGPLLAAAGGSCGKPM
jgi:cytochrome c biogenesis protein CcmG/thiol:disulfide interchange protein DsbE